MHKALLRSHGLVFQIVLNGMGGGEKHLKLTSIVFQTLFAPIDVAKVPLINGLTACDSVG